MRVDTGPPRAYSDAFESYYRRQLALPPSEFDALLSSLSKPLPLDLRVSSRAALASTALERLLALMGDESQPRQLTWVADGRTWQLCPPARARGERLPPERDYHQFLQRQQRRGALLRQESASMLPALLLRPQAHHACLDMCAAPGSKTIQLVEMLDAAAALAAEARLPSGGFIVANDASLDRAISLNHRMLSTNVASARTLVTSLDARWWPSLSRPLAPPAAPHSAPLNRTAASITSPSPVSDPAAPTHPSSPLAVLTPPTPVQTVCGLTASCATYRARETGRFASGTRTPPTGLKLRVPRCTRRKCGCYGG